jgi:hypothetical protein
MEAELLGVAEPGQPTVEGVVVAGREGGSIDLVRLVSGQVTFAFQGVSVAPDPGLVLDQRPIPLPGGAIAVTGGDALLVEEAIDGGADLGGTGDGQLVVLGDDLDQPLGGPVERCRRSHRSIEVGPAAAVGGEPPRRCDLMAVGGQEPALDRGLVAERSDQIEAGGLPQQHAQRSQQQGLAGAGFAGDDGEPGTRLDVGRLEDTQVADDELVEHQDSPNFLVTLAGNPSVSNRTK